MRPSIWLIMEAARCNGGVNRRRPVVEAAETALVRSWDVVEDVVEDL